MATADAVVIGAGINGAATAYNRVRRGMKVVLVEKQLIASGGTGRSAAIIRMPGSTPVRWHSDWCGFSPEVSNCSDILNTGLWPSGKWFYLTGSRPEHGGLCVLEDSHVEGWEGPEGLRLTSAQPSFYP